jgi:RNA polymerase II subunit A small phosphatase-like protein
MDMFLAHLADKFEVVIFTASLAKVLTRQYADPLIDILDTYSVFSSRLFRDSCVLVNGSFVKDLSGLGCDLSQVVIIDVTSRQNSPSSYSLQPENAIPVESWYDDPDDLELYRLLPILDRLAETTNIAQFKAD